MDFFEDPGFSSLLSGARASARALGADAIGAAHLQMGYLRARQRGEIGPTAREADGEGERTGDSVRTDLEPEGDASGRRWAGWDRQARRLAADLGLGDGVPDHATAHRTIDIDQTCARLLEAQRGGSLEDLLGALFKISVRTGSRASRQPGGDGRAAARTVPSVIRQSPDPAAFAPAAAGGASADPLFEAILECAEAICAANGEQGSMSLAAFALGSLVACDHQRLHGRSSLIHSINSHRAAIEAIAADRGWKIETLDASGQHGFRQPPRPRPPDRELARAIEDSRQHEDGLLAVLHRGAEIGVRSLQRARIAWHEAGHAIVSLALRPERDIEVVSLHLHEEREEGRLSYQKSSPWLEAPRSKAEVLDTLCVALAGRVAEQRRFGQASGTDDGATLDLRRATELAWEAITLWGMDDEFGPVALAALPGSGGWLHDQAHRQLQKVMKAAHARTESLIVEHWAQIEQLAGLLRARSRMTQEDILDEIPGMIRGT